MIRASKWAVSAAVTGILWAALPVGAARADVPVASDAPSSTESEPSPAPEASELASIPNAPAASEKPCAGCCDDCDRCCSCCKRKRPLEPTDVLGIRASLTDVRGTDHNGRSAGVMIAGGSEQYGARDAWTARISSIYALGGGSAGVEGALGGAAALGLRARFGESHGPFFRVGIGGELLGNSKLYYSHLELPLGEVGYSFIDGRTVFELGARGAPVLTGRYNTGDGGVRQLSGSFEWGGYAAMHTSFGRLDVSALRVQADHTGSGGPVDVARGTLCGYAGLVALCADAMAFRGDVQYGTPEVTSASSSFYGGFFVGFLNL